MCSSCMLCRLCIPWCSLRWTLWLWLECLSVAAFWLVCVCLLDLSFVYILSGYSPFFDRVGLPLHNSPSFLPVMGILSVDGVAVVCPLQPSSSCKSRLSGSSRLSSRIVLTGLSHKFVNYSVIRHVVYCSIDKWCVNCLWSMSFLLFTSSGKTVWLCLVNIVSFISLGGWSILVMWWQTFSVSRQCTRYCAERRFRWSSTWSFSVSQCRWLILDILCEPVMILNASFCARCILPMLDSLAFVIVVRRAP